MQVFGHGGHLSLQAQGKPRWWSKVHFLWPEAGIGEASLRNANFVAGAALCEPRRAGFVSFVNLQNADFVACAALREPRSADFMPGTALCALRCSLSLCKPQSADFVAGAALCALRRAYTYTHSHSQFHSRSHSQSHSLTDLMRALVTVLSDVCSLHSTPL